MSDETEMAQGFAIAAGVVAYVVFVTGLCWIAQGSDFYLYKLFAPKYEQVRHDTFKQSQAYNDGMATELQNMEFEYLQAKPEQKAALASIILHRAASYDENRLPADLRSFVDQLRADRGSR